MAKLLNFREAEQKLKKLPIGTYKIIDIIKIIVSCQPLQKKGLFENSPFGSIVSKAYNDELFEKAIRDYFKQYCPEGLLDCYVELKYQRVVKLRKIIKHLEREDYKGERLFFDKALAGSIDIAIRPDGRAFVWDGFRRAILALLNGLRFVRCSITLHPEHYTNTMCEEKEAFWFKVRNGLDEKMPPEELFKSGIVYNDPDSLKVLKVIKDMGVDVVGTNPGYPELGGFKQFEDTVLGKSSCKIGDMDYLVQSSSKQKTAWPTKDGILGYLTCGQAKLIEALEKTDENGNLVLDFGIYITHPDKKGVCELTKKLVKFAGKHTDKDGKVAYKNEQDVLTKNRLSGKSIESVAYNIGNLVLGLDVTQKAALANELGLTEEEQETVAILPKVNPKKAIAA